MATASLLLYYITDRTRFSGSEAERRKRLLAKIAEAADCGVDFIQLREKDLSSCDLEALARETVAAVRRSSGNTRLLINSRTDIALAIGADGVHLRSIDVSPLDVLSIWRTASQRPEPTIGVSCHTETDVIAASRTGMAFAVFGPVFEKRDAPVMHGTGLESLRAASGHRIPVIALGGITGENAGACLQAGAEGIAGIRLFQDNDIHAIVAKLRCLQPEKQP